MIEMDRAVASEPAFPGLHEPRLDVGFADMLVALLTFAASLAVLVYGLSAGATFGIFMLLHAAVLLVPAVFLRMRANSGGELTVPVLLMVATFATGPIGALGCAAMALALWYQRPSPTRLRHWYDYIAGVVARTRATRIREELMSGRLPSDPAAKVPRFGPILQGASVEEQQRVLGVIGRRYHADFRPALRKAMRNRNGFIRAQAAAVASRLDVDEKNRLWSTGNPATQGAQATARECLDVEPRRF